MSEIVVAGKGLHDLAKELRDAPANAGRQPVSVLILFADAGGGHRSLATALQDALQTVEPGTRVHLCDPLLDPESSRLLRAFTASYGETIRRFPRRWGAMYWAGRLPGVRHSVRRLIEAQTRKFLDAQLAKIEPQVIIPVHPLLVHPGWRAARRSEQPCGLLPVLCDLITVHPDWACGGNDLLVVPTEEARRAAIAHGSRRIEVLGQPVGTDFRPADNAEKATLRARCGLSSDRPMVLLTGGAEGAGNLHEKVRVLGAEHSRWQLAVVAGRNEALRRELAAIPTPAKKVVFGYVDNMPDLLRAAHVVVGKAGSQTIAEAMASGVPLVLTRSLPGQERGNIAYVTATGCGLHAPDAQSLIAAVQRLIDDAALRSTMAHRAEQTPHRAASIKVARECLRIAAAYQRSTLPTPRQPAG